MGNTRRQFDPEFRAGAVRIVTETDKPVAQVARDLGISPYTLHNWVQVDQPQAHRPGPASGAVGRADQEVVHGIGGTYGSPPLVVASLRMVATARGGDVDGVIFHSDRGSEYTAAATAAACRALGWCSRWAGSARRWTMPRPRRSTPR